MMLFNDYLHFLIDVVLVQGYGWVFFLAALIYMLVWLRRDRLRNEIADAVPYVCLEARIDELNEKSPLAMEQVFAAMHAMHQNFTWGEDLDGRTVLPWACEIVSLGGKVSYFFRLPERYRTLFESALFAQYPKAEVVQVEDYLRNLPHQYDPEAADFDFWGTQWLKKKVNAYPIRTFIQTQSFEHSAQETFIDPLSNVLEVMSNLQPHELVAYQLVLKPVNDDWKEHTQHLVDKLKGVPSKHSNGMFEKILFFIPDLIARILVEAVSGPEEGKAAPTRVQEEPPSLMLHRTDVEKMVISAIENAKGKVGYDVRIRTLYLAPKGKLNKALRIPEIVGAFRNFDDVNLNGIKPDLKHTWTDKAYNISPKLERPYLEMNILTRKRHFWHNFLPRSSWRGSGKVIMNTEELATIFHFPQVPHARVSQLERVQAVKAAPPMDLPTG